MIRACERCHKLKRRCDPPETWPCSACARYEVPCVPRSGAFNVDSAADGLALVNEPAVDPSQLDDPTRDDHIRGITKSVLPVTDGSNAERSYSATSSQRQGSRNEHLPRENEVSGHLSHAGSPPNSGLLDIGRNPAVDREESSVMLQPENTVTAGTLEECDSSFRLQTPFLHSQDKTALRQAPQMRLQSQLNSDGPDPKRYRCPSCSKSFATKKYLQRHLRRQRTSLTAGRIARLTSSRYRGGALHLHFLLQILHKKVRSFPAAS